MSREPDAPSELRARLRDWFVEELSVTDPDVPVASPPSAAIQVSSPVRTRGGWRFLGGYAAVVAAVVAGLVVLSQRDVERVPSVLPPPPTLADRGTVSVPPSPAQVDVGSLLTAACADLHDAAERLPLGADAAEVERVAAGILAALDRTDTLLSGAQGNVSVDAIRDLVAELRSRVADLPSIATTTDRDTLDQTVANVDLLMLAVGRRMEQAGGAGCADLTTLRERQ